jgi:molybdopterin molybdotransferase
MAECIVPVSAERIELQHAGGRILAQDVHADRASPACDVSAMDGYAVRLSDLAAGTLAVAGEVAIGTAPPPMPDGAALTIVTGAPVPDGAETVIKREDVTELPNRIQISADVAQATCAGMNIRRCGENVGRGECVVPKSSLVTPALAGALATFGAAHPLVFRRVRVGIVVTGNEVLSPTQTPTTWQLRDSHSSVLGAMFESCAWIDLVESVRVPDDANVIADTARKILTGCDALVLTGGVSRGDHDHVPGVVHGLGAQFVFHRLPQRPGHPALGAVTEEGKPILGLPGNPLSVLVTARRLALPALARRAGLDSLPQPPMVRLTNADVRTLERWWYPLIRRTGPGEAELLRSRGSADVASSATSDGFVELPPGASGEGPWPFYGWSL